MDYEKNKEALAIVEQMVADGQISQDVVEKYFPELKESEDEKIRKDIINFIKVSKPEWQNYRDYSSWIAWLEKQGEQKSVPDWMTKFLDELRTKKNYFDWDEHKDIEGGILAIINCVNPTYFNEKEGGQEPIEWSGRIGVKHAEGKLKEMLDRKEGHAWSEEDNEKINELCSFVYENYRAEEASDRIAWLKSLKGRILPQPKQEWSEEDKNMLQSILDEYKSMSIEKRNWLKSLKERYTWKPSEAQLISLARASNRCVGVEDSKILIKLLEQLKAL